MDAKQAPAITMQEETSKFSKTCRFLGKKFTGYYKKTKQSHKQVNNNHQIYEYKIKT